MPNNQKKRNSHSNKESKHSASVNNGASYLSILVLSVISLGVALINSYHVASLFENDRHFSHLSNLEREMTFRTEMGLYYSYFKTIVEADSFLDGTYQLYKNNINTLLKYIFNSLHSIPPPPFPCPPVPLPLPHSSNPISRSH